METFEYIITEDQIESLALELLTVIETYSIVALYGEMGAGKTRFVRALGVHLGISNEVGSPTFSIVNEYSCATNPWGIKRLFHMDLYRLKTILEAQEIGIQEYFDSGVICIIEWPELVETLIENDKVLCIRIEVLENQQRRITLTH